MRGSITDILCLATKYVHYWYNRHKAYKEHTMSHHYFVIGWRPHGASPIFLRGDGRYAIYLPYVDDAMAREGNLPEAWVSDIAHARIFKGLISLNKESIEKHAQHSKSLDCSRVVIYPYQDEILETQVLRPTRRPKR